MPWGFRGGALPPRRGASAFIINGDGFGCTVGYSDFTPVRGLTTGEREEWIAQVDGILRQVREALAEARQAVERADDGMAQVIGGLAYEKAMDDHGPERVALALAPALHAADLVRQARRSWSEDSLDAADAITHALDVLRGWVV